MQQLVFAEVLYSRARSPILLEVALIWPGPTTKGENYMLIKLTFIGQNFELVYKHKL
jgi:hypothetical protein